MHGLKTLTRYRVCGFAISAFAVAIRKTCGNNRDLDKCLLAVSTGVDFRWVQSTVAKSALGWTLSSLFDVHLAYLSVVMMKFCRYSYRCCCFCLSVDEYIWVTTNNCLFTLAGISCVCVVSSFMCRADGNVSVYWTKFWWNILLQITTAAYVQGFSHIFLLSAYIVSCGVYGQSSVHTTWNSVCNVCKNMTKTVAKCFVKTVRSSLRHFRPLSKSTMTQHMLYDPFYCIVLHAFAVYVCFCGG